MKNIKKSIIHTKQKSCNEQLTEDLKLQKLVTKLITEKTPAYIKWTQSYQTKYETLIKRQLGLTDKTIIAVNKLQKRYERVSKIVENFNLPSAAVLAKLGGITKIGVVNEKMVNSLLGSVKAYQDMNQSIMKHIKTVEDYKSKINNIRFTNISMIGLANIVTQIPEYNPSVEISKVARTIDQEIKVSKKTYGELHKVLDLELDKIDSEFVNIRQGAWKAFHSSNPDKLRQAVASMRELITLVIHRLAPDEKVKATLLNEKLGKKKVTREMRLLYILNCNKSETEYVIKISENILLSYKLFSKIEHTIYKDTEAVRSCLAGTEAWLYLLLTHRKLEI